MMTVRSDFVDRETRRNENKNFLWMKELSVLKLILL